MTVAGPRWSVGFPRGRWSKRALAAAISVTPWLGLACGSSGGAPDESDAASSSDASFAIDAKVDSTIPPDPSDGGSDAAPYVRFCDSPAATPYRYCIDFDDPNEPIPFALRNVTPHATLDVDPTTSMSAPNSAVMETPYVVPGGAVLPGLDGGAATDASDDLDAGWGPDATPRDHGLGRAAVGYGLLHVSASGIESQVDVRLDDVPTQVPPGSDPACIWGEDVGYTSFFLYGVPGAAGQSVALKFGFRWDSGVDGGPVVVGDPSRNNFESLPLAEGLDLGVWTRLVVSERFTPSGSGVPNDDQLEISVTKAAPPFSAPQLIFRQRRPSVYQTGIVDFTFGLSTYPYSAPHRAHFDNFLIRDLP